MVNGLLIPRVVIGIAGLMGSGKDTVGATLPGSTFVHCNFADPLKRLTGELFGFLPEHLWGPSERRNTPYPEWDGLTPRRALQFIGTEIGRGLHEQVWVRAWTRELERHNHHVYATDVRFPNEVEAIKEQGGFVVWVRRPPPVQLVEGLVHHASESAISAKDCHWTIDNTGTPAQAGQLLRQCVFSHYGLALGDVEG